MDKDNKAKMNQALEPYNNQKANYTQVSNYYEKIRAYNNLTDTEGSLKRLSQGFDNAFKEIEAYADQMKDSSPKMYSELASLTKNLSDYNKKLTDGNNSIQETADILNKLVKTLTKNSDKLGHAALDQIDKLLNTEVETVRAAENLKEILKRGSKTLGEALTDSARQLKSDIVELKNMFNIEKMVTGGYSLSQMRDIQHGVKVDLGLDTNQFLGLQQTLVNQNQQYGDQLGLSFRDTVSYLSSIKDYSFRNYNQATAMYKQVQVGTKYLGITNQGIASLVKATNSLANDSFMNRQLALLSALSGDSNVAENMTDLAGFIGQNATSVYARYGNAGNMLSSSLAIKSTADSMFGDSSNLITNLLQEIMGVSDFSQLSNGTKTLLSYAGIASNVQGQMRAGNVDFNSIITGVLRGTSNLQQYQRTTLEDLGLGNWVTLGGAYSNNADRFNETLDKQTKLLEGISITDEASLDAALKQISDSRSDKTFFEKFEEGIFNLLGIQNQNWSALLGLEQTINTLLNLFVSVSTFTTHNLLRTINRSIIAKNGLGGGDDSSLMSKLLGKGNKLLSGFTIGKATGLTALAGVGLTATGLSMGIGDAVKMRDAGSGGALRGFFLGTGASNHTSQENVASSVGNTAKYAAIGAGIGTFLGPGLGTAIGAGVGALAGLLTSLWGNSLEDNTEAVKKNTETYGKVNDTIYRNSVMGRRYASLFVGGEAYSGSLGMGDADVSNGVTWKITSPFGPRVLSNGDSSPHSGVDFGIRSGTPVGSPINGTVSNTTFNNKNTYPAGPKIGGNVVQVLGDNGVLYKFLHLSSIGVTKGQRVSVGQILGLSGNTGYSSGAHLHVGTVVNGTAVNPMPYLNAGLMGDTNASVAISSAPGSGLAMSSSSEPSITYMSQESLFNRRYSSLSSGGAGEGMGDYAKSSDIDRLIDAIVNIKNEQQEQKEFLQALSGKNKFVFTM